MDMFTSSFEFRLPNKYFLVAGSGEASTPLNAFDCSLFNSGIGDINLVKVSSIIPPGAKRIKPLSLPYGAIVPVAYAYKISAKKEELISCAVGVGLPRNKSKPGLIMEHSRIGEDKEDLENLISNMIKEGFKLRKEDIKSIEIISKVHKVKSIASVFAGVVLCY